MPQNQIIMSVFCYYHTTHLDFVRRIDGVASIILFFCYMETLDHAISNV